MECKSKICDTCGCVVQEEDVVSTTVTVGVENGPCGGEEKMRNLDLCPKHASEAFWWLTRINTQSEHRTDVFGLNRAFYQKFSEYKRSKGHV